MKLRFLFSVVSLSLVTACDNIADNRLTGDFESDWDAQNSVVLAEDVAFADGQDRYLLKIQMLGKNGEPIKRKILRLKTNRAGLVFDGCTESTNEGVTFCIFRSTLVGPQSIQLAYRGSVLDRTLSFKAPSNKDSVVEFSPANQLRANSSGYQVNLSWKSKSGLTQSVSGYSVQLSTPLRVRSEMSE